MEDRFRARAREAFAAYPTLQSVYLLVAQYWNDEADDAVHHAFVWSRAGVPEWPHHCPDWSEPAKDTFCTRCAGIWRGPMAPLSWASNGAAIPAFAEFCKPGSHQSMALGEAYTPYALITRDADLQVVANGLPAARPAEDGDPSAELQALLTEVYAAPASDLPRRVLADWLSDHGDPRGEFIARQLAGERDTAPAVDRWWRGASPMAPTEYRRGFPAQVTLSRPGADHPSWGTVEHLVLDGMDAQMLVPGMTGLTRIDGLNELGLWSLSELPAQPPLTHVELDLSANDWSVLSALNRDSLQSVLIRTAATELEMGRLIRDASWHLRVPELILVARNGAALEPLLRPHIDADSWQIRRPPP